MPRSNSGASANGANLVRPASAANTPRAGAEVITSSAQDDQRGDERVVGVGAEREQRERVRGPGVGEHDPERRPANRRPSKIQPEQREQVEEDRGRVRGGQRVPGAAPAEDQPERDVGVVVDRAVGVAVGVVGRPVAVQRLAVDQLVGADHARVADVDHVRVEDVEPDPERRPGTRSPTASHGDRDDQCAAARAGRPCRARAPASAPAGRAGTGRRAAPRARSWRG